MSSVAGNPYIDQDAQYFTNGELRETPYKPVPDIEVAQKFPPPSSGHDPGVECLGFPAIPSRSDSTSEATQRHEIGARGGGVMSEAGAAAPAEDGHHDATTQVPRHGVVPASSPDALQKTAELAMRVGAKRSPGDAHELAERPVHRVDSAQDSSESVPQLTPDKRARQSGHTSPLKLHTDSASNLPAALAEDSITKSPTLSKHIIQVEEKVAGSLPPVQGASPTTETSATPSSRKESLPSFRQLADLADIASQQKTQQDARPPPQHSHHHSHSFSSTTSQSPMIPYHHPSYTNSAQTSPVSYHGTMGESFTYPSPSQSQGSAYYYPDRRISIANESTHTYPTPVPSLPSNPSSGESQVGIAGSSTDGYSTSHTTPIDPGSVPPDAMQRPVPILPPPPGMPPGMAVMPAGGFTCDYPDCTAAPFQTQYLLSSHRNVHSQSRPHYCPVEGCPRSEGGRGFKRKNEMIRHGLVHNSPGYICPFCPDREHRYPRPDNLQRHVRVHHVDKDRDDPQLREVLAQRSEGAVQKQRRRRTQGSATLTQNQVSDSAP